ncbi:hypothetical protein WA026_019374 [Henosepilachna vigintioctopunctata]|uniref:Uncharacterized protein n=1 Tax=Henosepilachna vigintioctopunctata TaxID=420089 RepID=A0AAW1U9D9_9CUCU
MSLDVQGSGMSYFECKFRQSFCIPTIRLAATGIQQTQLSQQIPAGGGGTLQGSHQQPPLVMPVFPMRPAPTSTTSHYSPYSPSRFHIDKRCQHRCSWRCLSIGLILLAVLLTAMVAYFADRRSTSSAYFGIFIMLFNKVMKPAVFLAFIVAFRIHSSEIYLSSINNSGPLTTTYPPLLEDKISKQVFLKWKGWCSRRKGISFRIF